jgi:hypothetical protein
MPGRILQKTRKLRSSTVQSGFHGALRYLLDFGDFSDAQAFYIAQHKNGAKVGRDLGNGIPQLLSRFRVEHDLVGTRDWDVFRRPFCEAFHGSFAGIGSAARVHETVLDDPIEPGRERRFEPIAAQRSVDFDQCLLRKIVGIRVIVCE